MLRTEATTVDVGEAWRAELLQSALQGLDDLDRAGASEVVFVRCARASQASEYFDRLESVAQHRGFVTARVGVFDDHAFDSLDGLVRAVARSLTAPGAGPRQRGIVSLLDRYASARGAKALSAFDDAARVQMAHGDLIVLARGYLEAVRRPAREAARIEAWLSGTEMQRADEASGALAALSPKTAKRSLGELSRLVRVLGWSGTAVMFSGADVLTRLPHGRREDAYTVLRELVDNADGGRGLVAMHLAVAGTAQLFEGARGLGSLAPLAMRVLAMPDDPSAPPPPHRPCVDLTPPPGWSPADAPPHVRPCTTKDLAALRAVMRAAQGLPPTQPVTTMSVGHERIDATITSLFEHAAMESSVFALLVGDYGTGKSHLLMHLAARALADRRPVFRLSLERLDADLGNPQRHLRRLLEQAVLPLPDGSGPLDRLVAWTRSPLFLKRLLTELDAIVKEKGDLSHVARKAQLQVERAKSPGAAVESFLGAAELATKPSNANYRLDAYQRLMLWLALLDRLEGFRGPVVLIDEAENLYRGGARQAERRTALRSLSFYCGGTLPGACVVMAITPDALDGLRAESAALLDDVATQKTVLSIEDATMLRHRLTALRPIAVPALESGHRVVLAFKVQATHRVVRGEVDDPHWASWVDELIRREPVPREIVRRVTDRLESRWWRRG